MPISICPGDTVEISTSFLSEDFASFDQIQGAISVFDLNQEQYVFLENFIPQLNDDTYSFLWSPSFEGSYKISFILLEQGEILYETVKYFFVGDIENRLYSINAQSEQVFFAQLDPLFVDPEFILNFYKDGDLVEIAELIHWYSKEVLFITGNKNITEITPLMRDFIVASVLCDLSRIYVFGGGLSGFSQADSFTLGDLKVDKSTGGSGSSLKHWFDRGGVQNWCELAALLRQQLTAGEANFKAVVPGSNFASPIPKRNLRRSD